MALNATKKRKIKDFYTGNKATLLLGTFIKSGAGRGDDVKDANFRHIKADLEELEVYSVAADVTEAAGILGEVLGRVVEVQEPPNDNGAARKLAQLIRDSSTVHHVIAGVDVRLDNDQLKHQHADNPIGTRHKGGGNRFDTTCDATWHQTVTMAYMAAWANGLGAMNPGDQVFHGQLVPVNNVHYEAFCLFAGGQKYVLYHCYPSNNSPLRGPNG
jgi:hypothetical protein